MSGLISFYFIAQSPPGKHNHVLDRFFFFDKNFLKIFCSAKCQEDNNGLVASLTTLRLPRGITSSSSSSSKGVLVDFRTDRLSHSSTEKQLTFKLVEQKWSLRYIS